MSKETEELPKGANKRIRELVERAKKAEEQVTELTTALQHERADAVNLRRRHEAETAALGARAKSRVIADLLPAIDNFDRAFKHYKQEWDLGDERHEWIKGLRKINDQLAKALSDMGVQRIETVGQPFDPKYHEAISMEEGQGTKEVVSEELQAGYKLGDDVIRHAMVRVKQV